VIDGWRVGLGLGFSELGNDRDDDDVIMIQEWVMFIWVVGLIVSLNE
jgi:hypothetical protein